MSFSIKRTALVFFTVHYVELPSSSEDLYQIEYKRGNHKGCSEKMLPEDNIVLFDKRFRFQSTFYCNKENNYRPKLLNLKVLRFSINSGNFKKPKLFGKVTIDLSNYLSSDCPLSSRYPLESAHKQKSTIAITTSIKFYTNSSELHEFIEADTNSSLTSISDATGLTSDHDTSWDVSTFTPSQDSSSSRPELGSSILKTASSGSKRNLQEFEVSDQQRIENMEKRRELFNQKQQERSTDESHDSEEMGLSKLDSFIISSGQIDSFGKEKRKSHRHYLFQSSLTILKSALSYPWSKTPVKITTTIQHENNENEIVPSYPTPSSAIFGVVLYTQMLKKNAFSNIYFDSLLTSFFYKLKERKFVFQCTQTDYFNVLIHLVALFRNETKTKYNIFTKEEESDTNSDDTSSDNDIHGKDINAPPLSPTITINLFGKSRFKSFYRQLKSLTKDAFVSLCFKLSDKFDSTIRKMTNPDFDPGVIIDEFRKCYSEILSMGNMESEIIDIISQYTVMALDSHIVDYLLNYPNLCVLTNTMAWNYLITLIEGELPLLKLTLFKEASLLLNLSQKICENPAAIQEFAPHLPKYAAYKILLNQVPCEYVSTPPDPHEFYTQYSDQIREEVKSLRHTSTESSSESMSSKEDFEKEPINLPAKMPLPAFNKLRKMIAAIDTSNWKKTSFNENDRMKFSFVNEIFPVEEQKDNNVSKV